MKLRKLGLLFLILGFGGVVETAYNLQARMAIGPMGCRVLTGRFQGPSYTFESEEVREGVPAQLELDVENAFGAVRIWKGEPGQVKLRLRKVVFQPTEQRARELAERIHARMELQGDTLRVGTNRRELEQSSDAGFETHLSIEVPAETRVKLQNEHGAAEVTDAGQATVSSSYDAVRLERVGGPAQVENRHGDVTVKSVTGELSLRSRYGNIDVADVTRQATLNVEHGDVSLARVAGLKATLAYSDLSAEAVGGELEVHGRHAGVKAREVKGRSFVETSYRDVELRQLGADTRVKAEHSAVSVSDLSGALNVETSFDDVAATGIDGPLEARVAHGGFRGRGLRQGARVRTSGDDVELAAFEGPLEIEVERGSVRLQPEKPLFESISASAVRGGISLWVPTGSRFELDARAQRGDVTVDVPNLAVSESSPARVRARLGQGGKSVTLRTQHGDISVESRAATAAAR